MLFCVLCVTRQRAKPACVNVTLFYVQVEFVILSSINTHTLSHKYAHHTVSGCMHAHTHTHISPVKIWLTDEHAPLGSACLGIKDDASSHTCRGDLAAYCIRTCNKHDRLAMGNKP